MLQALQGKRTILAAIVFAIFELMRVISRRVFDVEIPEDIATVVQTFLTLAIIWFIRTGLIKKNDIEEILSQPVTELVATVEETRNEEGPIIDSIDSTKAKNGLLVFFLILFLSSYGCSNFIQTAHKSIGTTAITVDLAMKVCEELHEKGDISDIDVKKIKVVHQRFRAAYMVAVDSLLIYKQFGTPENEANLTEALIEMNKAASDILLLSNEFSTKEGR